MQYDPIKNILGNIFNKSSFLRKFFYILLDILLLRAWHIKKSIKKWATTQQGNVNILDAGSGFGQYSYFLSKLKLHSKITAIDLKKEQTDDCTVFFEKIGKKNITFKKENLITFREKEKYDLIVCVDVMEHILEDEMVFNNFNFSMKPGSMLLISTPSDRGGSDVHEHGDNDKSFIGEHVRNGYNINEIKHKLLKSGFTKVESYYTYGMTGKISWRLSMKYPIQLLGVSKLFFIILPFYYFITFPFCLLLNYFDLTGHHKTGTGLIVKAWK